MNQYTKWFEIRITKEKPQGESIMDRLYNRLDGIYLNKWRLNFPSSEAIDNWQISWAEAFEEEKITLEEIAAGIKYCRKNLEWSPSCSQFIQACRPVANSLTAYYEAIAGCQERSKGKIGIWSHPAIYWAAAPLAYDLLNQTYSQMKVRWESAYEAQMEKGQWEEIKNPIIALPPPSKSRTENKAAASVLKSIGASDMLKTSKEHTVWYRKILERIKAGDKTVSLIQRKFAEDAAREHGYQV
jgi:Replication protein P